MIADIIFKELIELNDEFYTKAQFSRDYLGKCRTYYNAIKTTEKTISKTALVNCWHRLRSDVKACEESMTFTHNDWMLSNLKQRRAKLDTMSKMVLEALIEQGANESKQRTLH